jgi:DNA ligase (NAD+)
MKISEARVRAEKLRAEISKHNDLYYKQSAPLISDFEYDVMLNELETIEKLFPELIVADSPTQKVGSDALKEFQQVAHDFPMLSLANTYTESELKDFDTRIRKSVKRDFSYVCELKLDGASISLKYSGNRFLRAVTRGDGEKGDDVTTNALTIKSIPRQIKGNLIPPEFTIRGEVIIHKGDFKKMNERRLNDGEQPFANPRNAASGTLKLLDSKTVEKRPLDCYLYFLLGDALPSQSHFRNMNLAASWGFKISDSMKLCSDINEVIEYINYWESRRKEIDYEIDGVVIKVDDIELQRDLGYTSKTPRWAVAFKYKAEQGITRLLSVSFQVGRTGAVTPVANLEPVALAGTTVKRASLHNADQIDLLDLHLNDSVYIEKGGEIIPQIIGVEISSRSHNAERVVFISTCPECATELVRVLGESAWYCPNDKSCPPQIKGRIEHFISRKAMNIDGMGEETVDLLFNENMIRDSADIYELDVIRLASLGRMGKKSAEKLMKSVESSKSVPWYRVLYALGIRHVGERTARVLTKRFRNIDDLISASLQDLIMVEDVGVKIASSIIEFFADEDNRMLIERLRMNGVSLGTSDEPEVISDGILKGKTIVISGVFTKHSRDEYKEIIIRLGGRNSSSVSSNTSFLLTGESAGPSKVETARELGVQILSENDFLKLTGEL